MAYKTYIVNNITSPPTLQGSNYFTLADGAILYGKLDLELQEQLKIENVYEHDNNRMIEALSECDCEGLCTLNENVIETSGFFGSVEIEFAEDFEELADDVKNIKHNVSALNFKVNEMMGYIKQILNKDGK